MTTESIRTMYRYNAWANTQVLAAAGGLSVEQFVAGGGASYDSIRDTLVHTMAAQWLYLERWQGRSPRTMPAGGDFADLASVRARWADIERATQAFTAGLTDARLGETVAYRNFKGERWAYPLWQQMLHQVNHATQHRSEAAVMLTHLGRSPGLLDLLYFIDVEPARA
ncbi:MAG TPA: DinB family protein [Methylomirabilota bacterium]|nr:DinB family protein [Methylomirabilota bacterium]